MGLVTSAIVSVPNSFLHCIMSDHMSLDFSISNFLALRNLHIPFPKYYGNTEDLSNHYRNGICISKKY